jgi:LacI family gluconate utilization system Gnt-I transcriptional repressor
MDTRRTRTPKRSRLEDVAQRAGVSTMTVVRVLREPHKVAPATHAKVTAALEKAQYTPDLVARSLASQRTGMVAAIVPNLSNSFIADTIQGMSDELALHDRQLILGAAGFSAAYEETLVRSFLSRRVDALYLTGSSHTPGTVRLLREAGLPVVEGVNLPDDPIDLAVGTHYADASEAIVRFLLERYGPDVAFVGGPSVDNDRMRDRRLGYQRAMRKAKAPQTELEVPISMHGGRQAMAAMLDRPVPPRAIFCATDVIAAGAVFECTRRKIGVPEHVAIAGYDDLEIAVEIVPALTTIRVPRYEIGRKAAQLIHMSLGGQRPQQVEYNVGFELIRRESA